jgi:uncharacterized protein (TIGR04255 family)
MSNLPNAPLIEVIFEIRWVLSNNDDLTKCQYLYGDLYALIKKDYPYREASNNSNSPFPINLAVPYRFRIAINEYPLVQVGPGLLTLNTIDSSYDWKTFESQIISLSEAFLESYSFRSEQRITISLQYFDLFKFNFENDNIIDFVSKNLNINIQHNFVQQVNPNNFNFGLNYKTDLGTLNILLNKGKANNNSEGLVMQTGLYQEDVIPEISSIKEWVKKSHNYNSRLFKNITKGNLYNSFNINNSQ